MPWVTRLGRYAAVPMWVIQRKLSGSALRLYAWMIVKHADWDTGQADPSVRQLADELDVTAPTISSALAELERQGLVTRESRTGYSTVYVLQNAEEVAVKKSLDDPPKDLDTPLPKDLCTHPPKDLIGPIYTSTKTQIQTTTSDGFDAFWSFYPRKDGKAEARKAWAKLRPDADLQQHIATALAWQRQTEQWLKDGHKFAPMATTYLHQRRWEDEQPSGPVVSESTAKTLAAGARWLEKHGVTNAQR